MSIFAANNAGLSLNYPYELNDILSKNAFLNLFKKAFVNIKNIDDYDSNIESKLIQTLDVELLKAYKNNNKHSLFVVHLCLNEILSRKYILYNDGVETSPIMFKIQQKIINAQMENDLNTISNAYKPLTIDEFKIWFQEKLNKYSKYPHPLFEYIENFATYEQFREFIKIEASVHVSFDDVIAFSQVGVRGTQKLEFFNNFNDELGSSNPNNFHLSMFEKLTNFLDIKEIQKENLFWEALSCGNYMMFLAYFRSYFHYCIGYLSFLEALTPARFGCIANAGKRLGFPSEVLEYHALHSELDINHAQSWLNNIILPEFEAHKPYQIRCIIDGILLRELVSRRYWDMIFKKI